jgi:hypothetical protein
LSNWASAGVAALAPASSINAILPDRAIKSPG